MTRCHYQNADELVHSIKYFKRRSYESALSIQEF